MLKESEKARRLHPIAESGYGDQRSGRCAARTEIRRQWLEFAKPSGIASCCQIKSAVKTNTVGAMAPRGE